MTILRNFTHLQSSIFSAHVQAKLWQHPRNYELAGLYCHLAAGPQSVTCGLYLLSIDSLNCQHHSREDLHHLLAQLVEIGLIRWDPAVKLVYVTGALSDQLAVKGGVMKPGDKRRPGIQKYLESLERLIGRHEFLEHFRSHHFPATPEEAERLLQCVSNQPLPTARPTGTSNDASRDSIGVDSAKPNNIIPLRENAKGLVLSQGSSKSEQKQQNSRNLAREQRASKPLVLAPRASTRGYSCSLLLLSGSGFEREGGCRGGEILPDGRNTTVKTDRPAGTPEAEGATATKTPTETEMANAGPEPALDGGFGGEGYPAHPGAQKAVKQAVKREQSVSQSEGVADGGGGLIPANRYTPSPEVWEWGLSLVGKGHLADTLAEYRERLLDTVFGQESHDRKFEKFIQSKARQKSGDHGRPTQRRSDTPDRSSGARAESGWTPPTPEQIANRDPARYTGPLTMAMRAKASLLE
jgi:hypothetical protein